MKSIEDKIIRNQFRAGVLILGIWMSLLIILNELLC
jgi:hypothetical protein